MSDNGGVEKIKVLVLDDDPARKFAYLQMGANEKIKVDFQCLRDADTSMVIKGLSKDNAPDIVFVDHRLDNTSSANFMRTGKCVTPILREKWPGSPIVGVTAAKKDCLDHDGNSFYEEVFDFADISQLEDFVLPIIDGYRSLKDISDAAKFADLLNAPEDEVESILHSVPDELRTLEADSFKHAMYRWFRRTLHGHPGFLYEKEWVAVSVGINKDNIDPFLDMFESAKYSGIWADPSQPRWWKKRLYEIALNERTSARESVQSAACRLFGVNEEKFSKCHHCGKKWPEILAFTDDSLLAELVPAHLECSIPHPKRYLSLSFEEPRIIVDQEGECGLIQ